MEELASADFRKMEKEQNCFIQFLAIGYSVVKPINSRMLYTVTLLF